MLKAIIRQDDPLKEGYIVDPDYLGVIEDSLESLTEEEFDSAVGFVVEELSEYDCVNEQDDFLEKTGRYLRKSDCHLGEDSSLYKIYEKAYATVLKEQQKEK